MAAQAAQDAQAAQAVEGIGPQPDFNRIAQCHQTLSTELQHCQNLPAIKRMVQCHQTLLTELQHCQNLPAIAGAQAILAAIARMEGNLTARMSAK